MRASLLVLTLPLVLASAPAHAGYDQENWPWIAIECLDKAKLERCRVVTNNCRDNPAKSEKAAMKAVRQRAGDRTGATRKVTYNCFGKAITPPPPIPIG